MKVPIFVTCSAAVLAAWLGLTYFRAVPNEDYPRLGRHSLPLSAQRPAEPAKPLVRLPAEDDTVAVVEAVIEE